MSLYQSPDPLGQQSPVPAVAGSVDIEGPAEDVRRPGLQPVEELEEEVRKRLDSACSIIVEETRGRLRQELAVALDNFERDASNRLRLLEEQYLKESVIRLQSQMGEQAQQQIKNIQATLDKPCVELKGLAVQADAAVTSMAGAVDAAAKRLHTAQQNVETSFAGVVDQLGRTADNLLRSSSDQLQKQADQAARQFVETLRGSHSKLIEQANTELAILKQTFLHSLKQETGSIEQECRNRLRQAVKDSELVVTENSEPRPGTGFEQEPQFSEHPIEQLEIPAATHGLPEEREQSPEPLIAPAAGGIRTGEPERPYTQLLGEITAARHLGSTPPVPRRSRSAWRTVAIWACLVIPLMAIFLASYYHLLRRQRGERLPESRKSSSISSAAPATTPSTDAAQPGGQSLSPNANPSLNPTTRSGNTERGQSAASEPDSTTLGSQSESAAASPKTGNSVHQVPERTAQEQVPEARGNLTITSDSPGAQITLDGRTDPGWLTPHTFTDLPARVYRVLVSKNGSEAAAQNLRVQPGSTVSFSAHLGVPTGEITILTNPPGLEVSIDGKSYGPSPTRAVLTVGQHTYTVTPPPGKAALTKTFTVKSAGDMLRHTVSW